MAEPLQLKDRTPAQPATPAPTPPEPYTLADGWAATKDKSPAERQRYLEQRLSPNVLVLAEAWLRDQGNAKLKKALVAVLGLSGPLTIYPNGRGSAGYMISTRAYTTHDYSGPQIVTRPYAAPPKGEISVVVVPHRPKGWKPGVATEEQPPTSVVLPGVPTAADVDD